MFEEIQSWELKEMNKNESDFGKHLVTDHTCHKQEHMSVVNYI